ncbi:MAG TPA: hypothetical protein VH044_04520, partial [Polyangiaceae bacterium]|nr:hypothetical protein [Polyangiaceae bacterium]
TTTTTTVALLAAGGGASSGESELGGDLRFAWGGRFAIGARVGFRELHDVVRVHGVIHGQDLQAGVAASYAFVPRTASWGGEVSLRADLVDVRFSGVAAPGASGRSDSALGAVVSGALGGWAKLGGPFRAVADAAVGTPLHSVSALDAGDKVTGISGVTFGLALGLGVSLQ